MSLLQDAQQVMREEGIRTFLQRTTGFVDRKVGAYSRAIPTGIIDRIKSQEVDGIVITTRSNVLGSASLSLVLQVSKEFPETEITVVVDSVQEFKRNNSRILAQVMQRSDVTIVEVHSREFLDVMWTAELFLLTSQRDLWEYRKCFDTSDRTIVRIYHGIITKGYGNHRTDTIVPRLGQRDPAFDPVPDGFDIQSVESTIELFYRSSAECRHPAVFRRFGYPQIHRAKRLASGSAEPLLSSETRDIFEETASTTRILYAPTADKTHETRLFPFEQFDVSELKLCLEENNCTLFLRTHVDEREEFSDGMIDEEVLFHAGQEFSPSSIEILSKFDILITNYSSIYVEYLPFDNPIIFIKDDIESYSKKRGLPYDYQQYFPGEKVSSFEELMQEIERCTHGEDIYQDDRRYVTRTLLPDKGRPFMESIKYEMATEESASCLHTLAE